MKVRLMLRRLSFVVILLHVGNVIHAQQTVRRPNIVFLLTDDHRWDALGAMGNPIVKTPFLDQLSNNGALFTRAFVTTSICSVSRASILSGQYMARHKIKNFVTDFSEQALRNTYPLLLKNAGYKIGFIGKYGVGSHPPVKSFDYWSCSEEGQPPYWLSDQQGGLVHHTDSVGRDIKKFLSEFGEKDAPFSLSVSFKAPHELDGDPSRYDIQPEYKNLYQDIHIPTPETAAPGFWEKLPDFFRTDANLGRLRWKGLFGTPELYQENVKNYYRLITGVDKVVGDMMKQLSDLGIADNTVIIFMGDNGFSLGEHGIEGKWYGYEESIRVPLIIYDPRNGQGISRRKIDDIALNIDIAPTILSLAGVEIPKHIQGINLYQLARGRKEVKREKFFYEHNYLKTPKLPNVEGVVTLRWKYMIYPEHGYEELYDIKKDPKETTNLALDPKFNKIKNRLKREYQQLKESAA